MQVSHQQIKGGWGVLVWADNVDTKVGIEGQNYGKQTDVILECSLMLGGGISDLYLYVVFEPHMDTNAEDRSRAYATGPALTRPVPILYLIIYFWAVVGPIPSSYENSF